MPQYHTYEVWNHGTLEYSGSDKVEAESVYRECDEGRRSDRTLICDDEAVKEDCRANDCRQDNDNWREDLEDYMSVSDADPGL